MCVYHCCLLRMRVFLTTFAYSFAAAQTYVGEILVVVNPLQDKGLINEEYRQKYKGQKLVRGMPRMLLCTCWCGFVVNGWASCRVTHTLSPTFTPLVMRSTRRWLAQATIRVWSLGRPEL